MYKFNHLERVTIGEIVAINLVNTPLTETSMRELLPSINLIKAAVSYVLANGLYEYPPLNIDSIGEQLVCSGPKELRKVLQDAIDKEMASNKFYGRDQLKTADQLFYQILIQCIHEYGHKSTDAVEYVVLTMMDKIFDEQAVEDQDDMLVWSLLIEFFSDVLNGRSFPFGKFIKERGSSTAKVQKFIEKNGWYKNPENFGKIFGIDREKPKIQEVMKSAIRVMAREHQRLIFMMGPD